MTEIATKIIVDCSTGEQRVEPLTEAELIQREADAQAYAEAEAIRQAEETAKAEAKASAITKLAALGLSDAEIAALTA